MANTDSPPYIPHLPQSLLLGGTTDVSPFRGDKEGWGDTICSLSSKERGRERLNTVAWNEIDWHKVELSVFKLQKRIYQASLIDNVQKLRQLQKTLFNSYNARLLAVRKVSQDNNGSL